MVRQKEIITDHVDIQTDRRSEPQKGEGKRTIEEDRKRSKNTRDDKDT